MPCDLLELLMLQAGRLMAQTRAEESHRANLTGADCQIAWGGEMVARRVHVAHHWEIATHPENGLYHAECKVCGAEKYFPQLDSRSRLTMNKKSTPPPITSPEWTGGTSLDSSTGLSGLL